MKPRCAGGDAVFIYGKVIQREGLLEIARGKLGQFKETRQRLCLGTMRGPQPGLQES